MLWGGALETSFWRSQYLHCVSKHNCWNKLCTLNCETRILLDMIILNYQTELVPHGAQCYLHMKGISPLKCSNCPYETLSLPTPPFSHPGSLSPWVTVARLQPRPVGPCKPRPERLAVWVTAPPPNTFIQRSSDYFSSFIWATKHSPTPNLALCWERESQAGESRAEEAAGRRGGCGWAPVGSVVSVWTRIKEPSWFLLACRKEGVREGGLCWEKETLL